MADKTQAQTVKSNLEQQYPGISFGLGRDGDDWTVEARDTNGLTVKLPSSVNGVKVNFRATGTIKPLA